MSIWKFYEWVIRVYFHNNYHFGWILPREASHPGFPEPSVPTAAQNNPFPTSQLKMLIPDITISTGKELCYRNTGSLDCFPGKSPISGPPTYIHTM